MITYSDVIEHLVTHLGGGADDRIQAQVRLAVYDAYRRVTEHPKGWRYYISKSRVNLNGEYSTGTIAYTASTRTFTLTDGTFPSWTVNGEIRIGTRGYKVATNPTSTTLTIDSTNAPTANIAAGTEYSLVQTAYPLPLTFADVYVVEGDDNWPTSYIPPSHWYEVDRTSQSLGNPIYWSVIGDSNTNSYGRKSLVVYPAPTTDAPHEFLMKRRPRALRYSGQSAAEFTGTVSISGTTVTGSGTSFSSRMVGSILRVTDSTTAVPTALGGLEPYTEEFVITAYTSATSITISSTPVGTYSGVKFRVSDPLDIDDCMESAIRAGAIYEIAKTRNETDAAMQRSRQVYLEELNRAWEIDVLRGIDRAGIPFFGNESSAGYYTTNFVTE